MPTKRHYKLRERTSGRTKDGIRALVRGVDFFGGFTGEELAGLWEVYGSEIVEAYAALDPTLRPGGWWWFGAPKKIRIAWPGRPPLPTEQREILLAEKILDAAAVKTAREKIAAWKASGQAMAAFDYQHPRPEIEL